MQVPEPITLSDRSRLVALEGLVLTGVTYHFLAEPGRADYAGGGAGFDSDLAAVGLNFDEQQSTVLTWSMSGRREGLTIISVGAVYRGTTTKTLDAAARAAWSRFVDKEVLAVNASWHVSGEQCSETLWAVRLEFDAGSVVIALGVGDTGLSYMPDEMVVVSDEPLARSYCPSHAKVSSWGDPLQGP